jgi:hypothetical protein
MCLTGGSSQVFQRGQCLQRTAGDCRFELRCNFAGCFCLEARFISASKFIAKRGFVGLESSMGRQI